MKYQLATFYRFFDLDDRDKLKSALLAAGAELNIRGAILVAHQGVNGTISGAPEDIKSFIARLEQATDEVIDNLKVSPNDRHPFKRLRVRLVDELIKFCQPGADPRNAVGTYVPPKKWNELIARDDVVLIDTRNDYELWTGKFENAIDPDIKNFTDFAQYVDTNLDPTTQENVAMYCTGGIRCEVATSYLLQKGFKNVYHLEGGILRYLEEIPAQESKWEGECFVFDHRVTVDNDLNPGNYRLCFGCGWPMPQKDYEDPKYEYGVTCKRCFDDRDDTRLRRARERARQHRQQLAQAQQPPRRGAG